MTAAAAAGQNCWIKINLKKNKLCYSLQHWVDNHQSSRISHNTIYNIVRLYTFWLSLRSLLRRLAPFIEEDKFGICFVANTVKLVLKFAMPFIER